MRDRIRNLTGIVVAGGKSSRMGQDKAFLDWQGKPLIQAVIESLAGHVSEIIVVAKEKEKFKFLKFEKEKQFERGRRVAPAAPLGGQPPLLNSLEGSGQSQRFVMLGQAKPQKRFYLSPETLLVADRFPYFSPLVGIATGLFYSRTEFNFVLACDMPQVKMGVVERLYESMEDFDAALPRSSYGLEPLCAVYRKSALGVFEARIRRGSLSVRDALEDLRVKVVPWDEETREGPLVFMNLNTPAEYGEGLKND